MMRDGLIDQSTYEWTYLEVCHVPLTQTGLETRVSSGDVDHLDAEVAIELSTDGEGLAGKSLRQLQAVPLVISTGLLMFDAN